MTPKEKRSLNIALCAIIDHLMTKLKITEVHLDFPLEEPLIAGLKIDYSVPPEKFQITIKRMIN